jgi:hypothetical protein
MGSQWNATQDMREDELVNKASYVAIAYHYVALLRYC